MCTQIASYYGLAVQRNKWKQFKCYARIKAVNAIPLHLGANDTNVEINQRNCPYFEDIWCQYQAVKFIKRPIHNIPTFSRKQRLILYLPSLIVVNITAEFIEKLCGGHWPVRIYLRNYYAKNKANTISTQKSVLVCISVGILSRNRKDIISSTIYSLFHCQKVEEDRIYS